jgi:hypothetical protein
MLYFLVPISKHWPSLLAWIVLPSQKSLVLSVLAYAEVSPSLRPTILYGKRFSTHFSKEAITSKTELPVPVPKRFYFSYIFLSNKRCNVLHGLSPNLLREYNELQFHQSLIVSINS